MSIDQTVPPVVKYTPQQHHFSEPPSQAEGLGSIENASKHFEQFLANLKKEPEPAPTEKPKEYDYLDFEDNEKRL